MSKNSIKHIWFDFSNTLAFINMEVLNKLQYKTYSQIVKRPVNDELIKEYKNLYKKFNSSNAAIFYVLGQTSNFWSEQINSIKSNELYELSDKNVPDILKKFKILFLFLFFLISNLKRFYHLLI